MKKIVLIKSEKHSSKEIMNLVAGNSPTKPISVAEMRTRVKIIDAIEAANDEFVMLEDAEHRELCEAVQNFPWQHAHPVLLKVIDSILDAPSAPSTPQLVKENK